MLSKLLKNIIFFLSFFIVIFLIVAILFGSILRHHYLGGEKFKSIQSAAVFLAEIPKNLNFIIKNRSLHGDVIEPINNGQVYKNKEFFKINENVVNNFKNNLILISRHDGETGRSIVELRDLNTFKLYHSYQPNIEEIYKKINLAKPEFKNLIRDNGVNRFAMWHPLINSKGELIFHSGSPLVKVDLNGKVIWVNDEDVYHHAINVDNEGNIYTNTHLYPISKKVSDLLQMRDNYNFDFTDNAATILNQDGEIIFSKSVTEILMENGYTNRIFSQIDYNRDPTHLNDIQPVLKDTDYFKKGDLFLSLRNMSAILLYRPSSNKIIRFIEGEFFNQHDIDILDESKISIFNNNVILNHEDQRLVKNNEIVIYDFKNNSFSKKFENTFINYKINTSTHGIVEFLQDGSATIEDRNNGRIFYVNNNGDIIWEFNNINSKNQLFDLWWSRVIDNKLSTELKTLLK